MKKEKTNQNLVKPEGALKGAEGKYITKFEYVCLILARVGGMFGTTSYTTSLFNLTGRTSALTVPFLTVTES